MQPKVITTTTLLFLLLAATTAHSEAGSGATDYVAADNGIAAASTDGIDEGGTEGIDEGGTDGIDEGGTEGIDEGGTEGIDEGGTDGIDEGGTEGIDEGGTEGIDEGGTEGIDEGGTEGIDEGGTDGIDEGGTEGIDEGGTEGIDEGGTEGIDEGGTEGIDEGGTDGIDEGGTEGIDEGGKEGIDEGGTEGIDEGGTEGIDEGGTEGIDEGGTDGIDEGGTHGIDEGGTEGIDEGGTESVVLMGAIQTNPMSVNGVLIDSRSAAITRDGNAFSLSEARPGQIVTVKGSLTNDTVIAQSVALSSRLTGPIESYDAASGTIYLLGHTVRIDSATVMGVSRSDLTAGAWIVVDAMTAQLEDVQATRIDAVSGGQVELAGAISQADLTQLFFFIGNQRIDFASASLLDVGTGMPETGQVIRVTGDLASDGDILRATIVTESDR